MIDGQQNTKRVVVNNKHIPNVLIQENPLIRLPDLIKARTMHFP